MAPPPPPPIPPKWPTPKLRIEVADLSLPGAQIFFENVHPSTVLRDAVEAVLQALYTVETVPRNVRSVTLYLRDMDGVAYTKGSDLDDDHKEIHFSTRHIFNTRDRAAGEIQGVLTHEMVHCFQFNGKGTCPGGLIEGIADFVRLRAGLEPPHWKRDSGTRWDEGYQTTGYFLDWIEGQYGVGVVRELNQSLRDAPYDGEVWKRLTGRRVDKLWELYTAER